MSRRSRQHGASVALRAVTLLGGFVGSSALGYAQTPITRMSVDAAGVQGFHESEEPAISADGRYVAFASLAKNLVPGDTNGRWDIFVKERATGAIVRVSVSSAGVQTDFMSRTPSISADGRFVAFKSDATNLVTGDTNNHSDIFVHDRDPDGNGIFDEGNGTTERVSVDSNGNEADADCFEPSISGDGMLVAFTTSADNLVANDNNNTWDVFVHDRASGTTVRVSVDSAGVEGNNSSSKATFASDGSCVAFESVATNFDPADTDNYYDVFVHELASGTTEWVSKGFTPSKSSGFGPPGLSSDGSIVAFWSDSSYLVHGDTNGTYDIFVCDRATGTMSLVSVDSAGVQGNSSSESPAISADGQIVTFRSAADNLAPNDANPWYDIFWHDRTSGITSAISVDCAGFTADYLSDKTVLSGDGQVVAFMSWADDLVDGDTNGWPDIFARDLGVAEPQAYWTNYGSGYGGTYGIPALTASADPEYDASLTIDATNSLQSATAGFVLVGFAPASIPTHWGGTLLVDWFMILGVPLAPSGVSLPVTIPRDPDLCGASAYLQVVELDAGATSGLSFTPGLQFAFGH
jgi:hypothetical protein